MVCTHSHTLSHNTSKCCANIQGESLGECSRCQQPLAEVWSHETKWVRFTASHTQTAGGLDVFVDHLFSSTAIRHYSDSKHCMWKLTGKEYQRWWSAVTMSRFLSPKDFSLLSLCLCGKTKPQDKQLTNIKHWCLLAEALQARKFFSNGRGLHSTDGSSV